METFQTWLPVFSGGYNTIWDNDISEDDIFNCPQNVKKELWEIVMNNAYQYYNNGKYLQEVCRYITGNLEKWFAKEYPELPVKMEIEGVSSPKEYNFHNDSGNVLVTVDKEKLYDLCRNNENFVKDIKARYTSCSGFYSSYPNAVDEFLECNEAHVIGRCLEFLIQEREELQEVEYSIYEDFQGNHGVTEFIDCAAVIAAVNEECGTNFTDFRDMEE